MNDKEFEQSIKDYYKNKQKEKTETIYVDVNKLVESNKIKECEYGVAKNENK